MKQSFVLLPLTMAGLGFLAGIALRAYAAGKNLPALTGDHVVVGMIIFVSVMLFLFGMLMGFVVGD